MTSSILCNDSTIADGKEIGDPTETALINIGLKLGVSYDEERAKYPRTGEVPFDSDRKLMSTCHDMGNGVCMMMTKGAVDVLLGRVDTIKTPEGIRDITEEDVENIEECNRDFSKNGLRVLAFACKEFDGNGEPGVEDENGLTFLGLISMMALQETNRLRCCGMRGRRHKGLL